MSETLIYRLGRKPGVLGETGNSFRGGMYVWNDVAKRYFDLDSFPLFDEQKHPAIWNAETDHNLPEHEIIVLKSTLDLAVVRGTEKDRLVAAFREYAKEHPGSSFDEQAEIIEKADIQSGDYIAWNQTAVVEFWGEVQNQNTGRVRYYNPKTGKAHFFVFDNLQSKPSVPKVDSRKSSRKNSFKL